MKYACAVGGFADISLPDYMQFAHSIGINYLEMGYGGRFHGINWDDSIKNLSRDILESADEAGVQIVALSVLPDFSMHTGHEFSCRIDIMRKAVALADTLHVSVIKVLAGSSRTHNLTGEQFSRVIQGLMAVGKDAERCGVRIGIENFDPLSVTVQGMRSLLAPLNERIFGVVYDPANIIVLNEDPYRFLAELSDRLLFVHLKDVQKTDNQQLIECALGDGIVDWCSLMEQIGNVYDGYYALEYPYVECIRNITEKSAQFLRSIMDD